MLRTLGTDSVSLCSSGKCPIFVKLIWVVKWLGITLKLSEMYSNQQKWHYFYLCHPILLSHSLHGWHRILSVYIKTLKERKISSQHSLWLSLKIKSVAFLILYLRIIFWFVTLFGQSMFNDNIYRWVSICCQIYRLVLVIKLAMDSICWRKTNETLKTGKTLT